MYLQILLNATKKAAKMVYNKMERLDTIYNELKKPDNNDSDIENLESTEDLKDLKDLKDFEGFEDFEGEIEGFNNIDKNPSEHIKPEPDEEFDSPPVAALELRVLENSNLAISCGWANEDAKTSQIYGYMLALLNNGGLKEEILKALYSHIEENKESSPFILQILENWEEVISSTPMKPSEVFSNDE